SEWSCVKIEDDIPFELAALVSCGVTTGFCSAIYAAEVRPGETVVVFGTGGVGINAVQGARYAGGKHVSRIDPLEFRREQAIEFGAARACPGPEAAHGSAVNPARGVVAAKVICRGGEMDAGVLWGAERLPGRAGARVIGGVGYFAGGWG